MVWSEAFKATDSHTCSVTAGNPVMEYEVNIRLKLIIAPFFIKKGYDNNIIL